MAPCPSKVSATPKQDRSAAGSESFDAVAKRLLMQEDPVTQVDVSATATGEAASAMSELVTPAAELATSAQPTTQFAHRELGRVVSDADVSVAADTAVDVDSQREAVLLSGYPLVAQPVDTGNLSPDALDLDTTQVNIDSSASADASNSEAGAPDGVVHADTAGDDVLVDDDFPLAVSESDAASVADRGVESLAAASEASSDHARRVDVKAESRRVGEHDESAYGKFDQADAASNVEQNPGELSGAAAETRVGVASSNQERAPVGNLDHSAGDASVDAVVAASVMPVEASDSSDSVGLQNQASSSSVLSQPFTAADQGSFATAGVVSGENSDAAVEGADGLDAADPSERTQRGADAETAVDQTSLSDAVDQEASASRATEPLIQAPPQQAAAASAAQVAGELASDSSPSNQPALAATRQPLETSDDATDPVEMDDSADSSGDAILQDSIPIESGGAAEFGGQESRRGNPFEPIVSAEFSDSNPLTNESPAIVPMDSPIDVGLDVVADQEIFETLSLEEFIQSSPASPEAVKKTAEVIHEAMRTSLQLDGQTVRLEVHPAELGTLKIHVTQTDQAIETQIIATEYVTSELLLSHRDQLMDALADAGFDASDVNISYQDQSSGESEGQHRPADHRYQSKSQAQSSMSRESVSGGGVNIVA
ncbi:flagellar hook-length control protein FliK [Stieleria maiorica]|nr:flagellar hook-length control protein FliK [Stieleria maiorica]